MTATIVAAYQTITADAVDRMRRAVDIADIAHAHAAAMTHTAALAAGELTRCFPPVEPRADGDEDGPPADAATAAPADPL